MKKVTIVIQVIISILLVCSQVEAKSLAVKGMSIGMDYSSACEVLGTKLGSEATHKDFSNVSDGEKMIAVGMDLGATFSMLFKVELEGYCQVKDSIVIKNKQNKVDLVYFSPTEVNKLFQVGNLSLKAYAKKFSNGYKLGKMNYEPITKGSYGYRHKSKNGYAVAILEDKSTVIYETEKVGEASFD